MRMMTLAALAMSLISQHVPCVWAQSEQTVKDVIERGECRDYGNGAAGIVLAAGFWAKAGSYVSVVARPTPKISDEVILSAEPVEPCISAYDRLPPSVPRDGVDMSGVVGDLVTDGSWIKLRAGAGAALPNPTELYALTGIYVDEKQDHPCLIRIYGRLVDPRFRTGDRKLGEHELESCKELFPGGFQNPVRVQLEGRQNRFLRGVRVCLGGKPLIYAPPLDVGIPKEHKVKGLQVRSAVVSGGGEVRPADEQVEPEPDLLRHCSNWMGWHTCPAGQIVSGLWVYEIYHAITALALQCANVRLVTAPRILLQDGDGF